MVRTSLFITQALRQDLTDVAAQKKTTVSTLARELLEQAIGKYKQAKLEQMYDGLEQIYGVGETTDPQLANQTVDEVLYGEKGVWRGKS